MEAKTTAMWKALYYCKDKGFAKIEVQTYSLESKDILAGERKPLWKLINKIESIQK